MTPGGTPNISNGISSPKAGVAITPVKWLELFANYGQGFRSIDVPAGVDRQSGTPAVPDCQHRKAESSSPSIGSSFLPATGTRTPGTKVFRKPRTSRNIPRQGAAGMASIIDGRYYVSRIPSTTSRCLRISAGVRARLIDAAPSFYVPNVPTYVANVGVDFNVATVNAQTLSGSAYVTFIGKKYLTQDGRSRRRPFRASRASSPIPGRRAGRSSPRRLGIRETG